MNFPIMINITLIYPEISHSFYNIFKMFSTQKQEESKLAHAITILMNNFKVSENKKSFRHTEKTED